MDLYLPKSWLDTYPRKSQEVCEYQWDVETPWRTTIGLSIFVLTADTLAQYSLAKFLSQKKVIENWPHSNPAEIPSKNPMPFSTPSTEHTAQDYTLLAMRTYGPLHLNPVDADDASSNNCPEGNEITFSHLSDYGPGLNAQVANWMAR